MQLVETCKIIGAANPANYTGAAFAGKYVSMKNYAHLTCIIHTGAWAAGTAAVTIYEATDVAAATNQALNLEWVWTGTAASGALTKTAVTSDTFNLSVANTMYVLEFDATEFSEGYDCFSVLVGSPGVNADYYSIDYILSGSRYAEDVPPTAILD